MTQADRVLDELRHGPVDIRDFPAGFRLAARVSDLRTAGHDITTTTIRLPGGAKVARYELRPTPTATAPTRGDQLGAF